MRRFGSNVSVIERNTRLLHREDEDVTEELRRLFEDEGVDIVVNARVKRISGKSGQSVRITIEQNGVERTLEGSHVLVAAGRVVGPGIRPRRPMRGGSQEARHCVPLVQDPYGGSTARSYTF
jgi:pyruvate/2-oxoglutarate dehydrogenase complex dihydrolipoamide dehydrogenase (E3) component